MRRSVRVYREPAERYEVEKFPPVILRAMKSILLSAFLIFVFATQLQAQYWKALGGGTTFGVVNELQPDTFHHKLYVGGNFDDMGNTDDQNLAVWDGIQWIKLNVEPDIPLTGLAMKGDTLFYISGTSNDHQVGMYLDSTFIGYLTKPGGFGNCLYVFHDTLYAGGEFSGGVKYWNGSQWKKLGGGVGGSVHAIGSYNEQLIVGGHFSDAGGVAVNNIAAWDGSAWSDMNGGMTNQFATPYVYALEVYNGKIYAGGDFDHSGGVHTGSIASWNGSEWDTVLLSSSGNSCGIFYDMYVDDTTLYVTGSISGGGGCMGDLAGEFVEGNWYNMHLGVGNSGRAITVFNGDVIAGGDNKYGYNGDTLNYVAHFIGSIPTSTQEVEHSVDFDFFPNPTSTTITLSLPSNQNAMLSIFNILGENVKEEKVTGKQITMDVSSLPQGLYLVRTENRMVGKFVKE